MKNKLITTILLLILLGILSLLGFFITRKPDAKGLINPDGKTLVQQITNQIITPTQIPTPTPIKFQFDKTTNLQQELDSINPEVLDSDFDNLKKITASLSSN